MKRLYILLLTLAIAFPVTAQKKIKVLFIGDSYTSANNLPLTVADIALQNGDTLIYDSNTPGGTTFEGQCQNPTTLALIAEGGWDYVVLQPQSEELAFFLLYSEDWTFPYAHELDSLIHAADSCSEPVFFMTWGHQNGDTAYCPYACNYTIMQDSIISLCQVMGQVEHATVAPVGVAWQQIMNTNPSFDLFISDSTHPSIYGTYLAASVFYEILFQRNVINSSYVTPGIADSIALQLRETAHYTVSDSLAEWFSTGNVPIASFTSSISGALVNFTSTSINGDTLLWNFGDNSTGSGPEVAHTYSTSGSYTVTLTAYDGCKSSSVVDTIVVTSLSPYYDSVYQVICKGDTFLNHTTSGIYIDTLHNNNGNDTIIGLYLTVNKPVYDSIYDTIPEGGNYLGHTTSGIYTDTLLSFNGCDSFVNVFLTVKDTTTGIELVNGASTELILFPNPASESINLSATFVVDGYVIYSVEGKEMTHVENLKTKQAVIDVNDWAKGIYILQAYTGQQKLVRNFAIF